MFFTTLEDLSYFETTLQQSFSKSRKIKMVTRCQLVSMVYQRECHGWSTYDFLFSHSNIDDVLWSPNFIRQSPNFLLIQKVLIFHASNSFSRVLAVQSFRISTRPSAKRLGSHLCRSKRSNPCGFPFVFFCAIRCQSRDARSLPLSTQWFFSTIGQCPEWTWTPDYFTSTPIIKITCVW